MAEHTLLNQRFDRSTDALLARLIREQPAQPVRIWLFEGLPARQALTAALAEHGIQARAHSAYKPLVHYFLEEADRADLSRVLVRYPVHPACHPGRFRLEAYPLAALLPGVDVEFEARPTELGGEHPDLWYQVELQYAGGAVRTQRIFAPNRLRTDALGQTVCVPCAWLIRHEQPRPVHVPLECEYQQCYDAVLQAVTGHDWGASEPYFDRLLIQAFLPGIEQPLAVGHETISTTEALHEDIYFSLLEFFQRHSGRPAGSRGLQPGQIIPDIRLAQEQSASVRVSFEPATALQDEQAFTTPRRATDEDVLGALAGLEQPISRSRALDALHQFHGTHFAFPSRQHRPVAGVYHPGNKPAILISGAQHANETTGVVGALRAADALRREPGAHFALIPLENPDGYALHKALRQHNPRHMLHAARYSALGDDIEYREHAPWFERRARDHAFAISQARLHLNLHGYPAHEWTRPSTGYLPRGFELWSIPKGFFLILRHRQEYRDQALALLDRVTRDLAGNAPLLAYNERQLDTYRRHVDAAPFQVLHGIPYLAAAVEHMACNVTLITEFPDETIAGGDFILGHTVQMQTVQSAARWWWEHA